MIDEITLCILAHHAVWLYTNTRAAIVTQILPLCTIYVCVTNKGYLSNVLLCLIFNQTINNGFWMLIGWFNGF